MLTGHLKIKQSCNGIASCMHIIQGLDQALTQVPALSNVAYPPF